MLCGVSQTGLSILSYVVIQWIIVQCIYIVEEWLCVSAKSRVTVDSADSSGSPGEAGPVRRSSRASSGESWILARSRRSPALSK